MEYGVRQVGPAIASQTSAAHARLQMLMQRNKARVAASQTRNTARHGPHLGKFHAGMKLGMAVLRARTHPKHDEGHVWQGRIYGNALRPRWNRVRRPPG